MLKLLGTAVAVMMLAFAGSASAASVIITSSGTIKNSIDASGVFGAPGASLDGLKYELTMRFDADLGYVNNPTPGSQALWGGSEFGLGSLGPTTLTIKGVAFNINSDVYAQYTDCKTCTSIAYAYDRTSDAAQTYYAYVTVTHNQYALNPSVFETRSVNCALPASLCSGLFEIETFNHVTNTREQFAFGELVPSYIHVGGVVPEPSTWAMMIVGFGLAGTGLRRARSARALAA